eukprot:gene12534-8587_t
MLSSVICAGVPLGLVHKLKTYEAKRQLSIRRPNKQRTSREWWDILNVDDASCCFSHFGFFLSSLNYTLLYNNNNKKVPASLFLTHIDYFLPQGMSHTPAEANAFRPSTSSSTPFPSTSIAWPSWSSDICDRMDALREQIDTTLRRVSLSSSPRPAGQLPCRCSATGSLDLSHCEGSSRRGPPLAAQCPRRLAPAPPPPAEQAPRGADTTALPSRTPPAPAQPPALDLDLLRPLALCAAYARQAAIRHASATRTLRRLQERRASLEQRCDSLVAQRIIPGAEAAAAAAQRCAPQRHAEEPPRSPRPVTRGVERQKVEGKAPHARQRSASGKEAFLARLQPAARQCRGSNSLSPPLCASSSSSSRSAPTHSGVVLQHCLRLHYSLSATHPQRHSPTATDPRSGDGCKASLGVDAPRDHHLTGGGGGGGGSARAGADRSRSIAASGWSPRLRSASASPSPAPPPPVSLSSSSASDGTGQPIPRPVSAPPAPSRSPTPPLPSPSRRVEAETQTASPPPGALLRGAAATAAPPPATRLDPLTLQRGSGVLSPLQSGAGLRVGLVQPRGRMQVAQVQLSRSGTFFWLLYRGARPAGRRGLPGAAAIATAGAALLAPKPHPGRPAPGRTRTPGPCGGGAPRSSSQDGLPRRGRTHAAPLSTSSHSARPFWAGCGLLTGAPAAACLRQCGCLGFAVTRCCGNHDQHQPQDQGVRQPAGMRYTWYLWAPERRPLAVLAADLNRVHELALHQPAAAAPTRTRSPERWSDGLLLVLRFPNRQSWLTFAVAVLGQPPPPPPPPAPQQADPPPTAAASRGRVLWLLAACRIRCRLAAAAAGEAESSQPEVVERLGGRALDHHRPPSGAPSSSSPYPHCHTAAQVPQRAATRSTLPPASAWGMLVRLRKPARLQCRGLRHATPPLAALRGGWGTTQAIHRLGLALGLGTEEEKEEEVVVKVEVEVEVVETEVVTRFSICPLEPHASPSLAPTQRKPTPSSAVFNFLAFPLFRFLFLAVLTVSSQNNRRTPKRTHRKGITNNGVISSRSALFMIYDLNIQSLLPPSPVSHFRFCGLILSRSAPFRLAVPPAGRFLFSRKAEPSYASAAADSLFASAAGCFVCTSLLPQDRVDTHCSEERAAERVDCLLLTTSRYFITTTHKYHYPFHSHIWLLPQPSQPAAYAVKRAELHSGQQESDIQMPPPLMPTQANIDALSHYAQLALTSPIKSEREAAASQLRFLSSFDAWDTVKELFPVVHSNYLLFILAKAILFIVSNEIGPEERQETLNWLLRYLQSRSAASPEGELPRYVRIVLYSIIASAFHSNWKYVIISSSTEDLENADGSGGNMALQSVRELLFKLSACLPLQYLLECLTELVNFFTQQSRKLSIHSVNYQSTHSLLPLVLETTVQALPQFPVEALELCALTLQSVQDRERSVALGGSSAIVLESWEQWSVSITALLRYCLEAYTRGAPDEVLRQAGQCMELCANIESSSADFEQTSYTLAEHLMQLADFLIETSIQQQPARQGAEDDYLVLAISLLCRILEHDGDHIVRFLDTCPDKLAHWSQYFNEVLQAFSPHQEEEQKAILRLYGLLDRCILPDETAVYASRRPAYLPSASRMQRQRHGVPSYQASEALREVMRRHLTSIFRTQLTNVVHFSPLHEDSLEVRSEAGLSLHNERMLEPLADLLFSQPSLQPIVEEKLNETLSLYNCFTRMRMKLVTLSPGQMGGGGGEVQWSAEEQRTLEQFAAAVQQEELRGMHSVVMNHGRVQQLSHYILICLSRLSVVISIFAMAISTGRVEDTESVLLYVGNFAAPLLRDDESLTEALLENISLDGESNSQAEINTTSRMLHFGIIRSLFFFCNSIFSAFTREVRHELFSDITLSLMRFVFLHHSDEPALVNDASFLLLRSMSNIGSAKMLGSDKMLAVLFAIKEKRIPLLQHVDEQETGSSTFSCPLFPSPAGCRGPEDRSKLEDRRKARSNFLSAVTVFIETRFFSGFSVFEMLETLLQHELRQDQLQRYPRQCLENLLAITNGCRQFDTFQSAMELVLEHSADLSCAIRANIGDADVARTVINWCARASRLAAMLVSDSGRSYFTYDLVHLVMHTIVCYLQWLAAEDMPSQGSGLTRIFFQRSIGDVEMVYDAFEVLDSLCSSDWCKLGVLIHYERRAVEYLFNGVLHMALSTSVEMLMSSSSKDVVFRALSSALSNTGDTLEYIFGALLREGVWEKLVRHLSKCIGYGFSPQLLSLLLSMLRKSREMAMSDPQDPQADRTSPSRCLAPLVIRDVFREVLYLVIASPFLEVNDLYSCFGVLTECFLVAPEVCTKLLSEMLDYCSAYHRVRLRCIHSQLMQNRPDMVEAYVNVFGQSSKVNVLSPW